MISVQCYECYCILLRGLIFWDTVYIYIYIHIKISLLTSFFLPFSELSLVGLAHDVVDQPSSFSAVTLLVGSPDP